MPRQNVSQVQFNRGLLSRLGLARAVDIKRAQGASVIQNNWLSRPLGSMSLRPGTGYLGSTRNNLKTQLIPFIFSTSDTAKLEFTDGMMRVWRNDVPITVPGSNLSVVNGDFTGSEPTLASALANPIIAANTPNGEMVWSPDGTVCLQLGSAAPFVNAFALNGGAAVAITGPATGGTALGGVFTPDGTRLYLSVGANVQIYSITGTGATMVFTFLANLSPAPASNPTNIDISNDGQMLVVGRTASTTAAVYYKTGDTYSTVTGPTLTWAAATATGVSVSHDGNYVSVASGTTPFINVFRRTGAAPNWTFTKLADPAVLPTGAATDISVAPDNTAVAVSHTTSPFVTIYTLNGSDQPVKVTNPGTLPAGNGTGVHYSPNNDYLAVSHTTTPFVTIYTRVGTTYTKITNPGTLPAANALGVRFNQTERHLAVVNASAPTIQFYNWVIWADSDQPGATSTYSNGVLSLTGTIFNSATRRQWVGVPVASLNTPLQLRFTVTKGYITIRIGSWLNKDDLFSTAILKAGTHSFTITPTTGHFVIELSASTQYTSTMTGVQVESQSDLQIPTIWSESDLKNLRYTQSGDVVFIGCKGKRQQQVERRSDTSWSVVDYNADDGPFRVQNTTGISMTPSALTGDITISSSQNFFKSTNVGGLMKITSIGQTVIQSLNNNNQFTNEIKVTGVGGSRDFSITRAGTWTGTLTVQRSVSEPGAWVDTTTTYTGNGTATYNDGLDNQIVYYRIGFKAGDYGSGTADITLTYESGGLTGIARITSFETEMSVGASVLKPFGSTTGSTSWNEGDWSPRRGYPGPVALYEGRLFWAGKDRIWGSVSDAFSSYDSDVEGDSGPISRSIGEGPVDTINWLLPLQRLGVGAQGAELIAKSSSFDEPLTPSNFNLKSASTQGSAPIQAHRMDAGGIFVQQGGTRVFEITYDAAAYDYNTTDLSTLVPELCEIGIVATGIQRKPDTRLHCILADGTAAVMVYDKVEDVICWSTISTNGLIEGVLVLPPSIDTGAPEDRVYYVVARTVDGITKRYVERWAEISKTYGGIDNRLSDSYVIYNGAPTLSVPAAHLDGLVVSIWGDSKDQGTATVSNGQVALPIACSNVIVGLPYIADFKSAKLAYAAEGGTPLNQRKKVPRIAFILDRTHARGLQYGSDFDHLRDMPSIEHGAVVGPDTIWDQYDADDICNNGMWDTDSRFVLRAQSPRPCTVLSATITVEVNG